MKQFMGEDFLLGTDTAVELYRHIEGLPIIDYHCHLDPAAIAGNARFRSITEAWLGGDHYKWRLMRHEGVAEEYITGGASDEDKFKAFCATMQYAVGNPVFHWAHLELRKYFGYEGAITEENAMEIFELCNRKILGEDFTVRGVLNVANVEWLATTDDPADTLEHHKAIKGAADCPKVMPTWRPGGVLEIEKPSYADYMKRLGATAGMRVECWDSLLSALENRMDFFAGVGCKISDHSLEPPVFAVSATDGCAAKAMQKALGGEKLTQNEIDAYKTRILSWMGGQYHKRGWVMQLHMAVQRNNNTQMFGRIGADTGFDAMSDAPFSLALARILDDMENRGALPRTLLYALNPNADDMLATMIGSFAGHGIRGRMQWGCPWWFNDNKPGMQKHLITLANHGMLSTFIGMLTDSRSFLSYPRHEYFRRVLARQLGEWVENGEFPRDMPRLKKIAADIAYYNVRNYFGEV